ncbi:hypothetical protein [Burkholderia sp. WP9]|uniref:hypothetical protein n=1 Tax=Burkholderia sp. WP9 TaxID=1500263 RepID=UPI0015A67E39|nr:hypothetical protein [Burkholderia sp. WP9]
MSIILVPGVASAGNSDISQASSFAVGFVIFMTYVISFFAILIVARSLTRDPSWSLAAALSEEAIVSKPPPEPITTTTVQPDGTREQVVSHEPADYSVLAGSTSRIIAVFGMIVILAMFLGFGAIAMWRYGVDGDASEAAMTGMMKYLFGGIALFVPYAFNQIQKCFSVLGFSNGK